jgi:hypothetical protein
LFYSSPIKKIIVTSLLYISPYPLLYGKIKERAFEISPGVSYQKDLYAELNFMYSKRKIYDLTGLDYAGVRVGVESRLNNKYFLIIPKIGYEASVLIFCVRGNILAYLQNNTADVRFLPEVGIYSNLMYLFKTEFSFTLTYGYNFRISAFENNSVSKNIIRFTFNVVLHNKNVG